MANWRIFYGSGTTTPQGVFIPDTASNIVGAADYVTSWLDAPSQNVQAVIVSDAYLGRGLVTQRDYYYRYNNEVYGVDIVGLWQGVQDLGRGRIVGNPPNQQYQVYINNNWVNVPDYLMFIEALVTRGFVKIGKAIDNATYRAVIRYSIYDPDFPKKNGYYPWELQPSQFTE